MPGLFARTASNHQTHPLRNLASPDLNRLRTQINQTKEEINTARNHFEQAVDPTLIDCYIYEINAAQLRYQFLLRRFKDAEEACSRAAASRIS
ncbi:MAG: YaaL family protein [Lachnospiraceae bacterium]|nr:YaaL family protein [Lachnospiraceae bacterium]